MELNVTIKAIQPQNKRGKLKYLSDIDDYLANILNDGILESIGSKTVKKMRRTIVDKTRRADSTNTLADSIDYEIERDDTSFALRIGNISKLPKYWYVVNYGMMFGTNEPYYPVYYGDGFLPNLTKPDPQFAGGIGTERFLGNEDGKYLLKSKVPITPMNYIESGVKTLKKQLNKYLANKK